MDKRNLYLMLFLALAIFFSCGSLSTDDPRSIGQGIDYDLTSETRKYVLGLELEEISGLTWEGSGQLACIQDEDGVIYLFDLKSGKVSKRVRFRKSGDYEGIEKSGGGYYVLKSSGKLLFISEKPGGEVNVDEIKTPFSSENNMESLGPGFTKNELLAGTKGKGQVEGVKRKGKGIYGFDKKEEKFRKDPAFMISRSEINEFLNQNGVEKIEGGYGISGVAVHPKKKEVFAISSEGKFLLVLSREGKILNFTDLPRKKYKQPEGICFSPEGDLFISNEGRGGAGNILHFEYLNTKGN